MKILSKIKAYFNMLEFLITVFFVIIFMYIFNKKHRKVRQIWAKSQKYLMGYKIKQIGEIDENANLIIVNHQSLVDIIVLEDIHPKNLCWVAKEEITKLPLYGHIMRAPKMISVQRESAKSLVKLIKDVKDRISKNRVVAIFPEGTRGRGQKLLKFKPGAKFIADKLNLKVQPIVVVGSREIFNSKEMLAKSGEIKVIFLPLVKLEDSWYEKMQEKMQEVLTHEL